MIGIHVACRLGTPCSSSHSFVSAACTILFVLMRQHPFRLREAMETSRGSAPSFSKAPVD